MAAAIAAQLQEDLLRTLHGAAPEKAEELELILATHPVKIVPVFDQAESPLVATPELGEIRAYIPVFKRFLAMAYAYVLAHRAAANAASTGGLEKIDSISCPELRMAGQLLSWAMIERVRVSSAIAQGQAPPDEDLPANLTFPNPNAPEDSADRIAIELFYMALAADLHHDYLHIIEGHGGSPPDIAVQQELRADEYAAEWLLRGVSESDPHFEKRVLGYALSQLYEVFLKLEGYESDERHPELVERLRRAVRGRTSAADHILWSFVNNALLLHLELTNRRRQVNLPPGATEQEVTEYLLSLIDDKLQ